MALAPTTGPSTQVFFKALGANRYKPKAAKAVKASKDNYCREEAPTLQQDWCFV